MKGSSGWPGFSVPHAFASAPNPPICCVASSGLVMYGGRGFLTETCCCAGWLPGTQHSFPLSQGSSIYSAQLGMRHSAGGKQAIEHLSTGQEGFGQFSTAYGKPSEGGHWLWFKLHSVVYRTCFLICRFTNMRRCCCVPSAFVALLPLHNLSGEVE